MSSDITLGAATRSNLLALQNINSQINTSEGHLATGLKVASAVDNAVSFFQAQSLTNRANDFLQRKNDVDQGISSLTTASQGAQSVISILQQVQGVLNAAKTETGAQLVASKSQLDTLGSQLDNLVADTSFQGLNLISSTSNSLTVQFSLNTTSSLKVSGFNLNVSSFSGLTAAGQTLGTKSSVIKTSAGATGVKFSAAKNSVLANVFNVIQNAITTTQGDTQTLGANITLLQTRLSFTSNVSTTLSGGADKLTLADVNKESTNLVTLQTRQQLSIQSLSIATGSEQAVLRLFH